ncbi:MAG: hypothetical protein R3271_01810 [Methylophaga sp.]|uniref:hypothetical protein n=1 Tax=Methylophaga sp. TaxID=2024840 RepID=UPI00299DEEFA|nr:hypothetical protein [Methylophaga sp.]MDX1749038.1 hypothetical protein [Methylophaga sp.]
MTTTNNTITRKMTAEELEEQGNINYDALNVLLERLEQLSAMLKITYGNDSFDEWNHGTKDSYLWACSAMLEQAKEEAEKIHLGEMMFSKEQ